MWQSIKSILKQEKGMAMVAVLGMFVVIMILTTSMLVYYRQDVRETTHLENRIQAYYLALAGIELGYAALMVDEEPLDANPNGPLYLEKFINHTKDPVTHHQDLPNGDVEVRISNVEIDGHMWVQVRSEGTLDDSDVSVTTNLRIDWENPKNIVREQPDV